MDSGVAIFPTHDAIGPAEIARLAEERGHESLFFPEHTHIPAGRECFQRAAHWLPSAGHGPVERALDRYEAAVAELRGE